MLDWGRYLDGQLTFRFLLRRDPMLGALKEAADRGVALAEIAPYVPRGMHCTRGEFEARGAGVLVRGAPAARDPCDVVVR